MKNEIMWEVCRIEICKRWNDDQLYTRHL